MTAQTTMRRSSPAPLTASRLTHATRALIILTVAIGAIAHGQETKPAGPRDEAPSGTVLNAEFAKQLGDPNLDWPSAESIAAAARDAEYARYDACRWQEIVLAKPFAAAPFKGREARDMGKEFVAGVSAGGYDAIYHCWETQQYRLQFRCTRWLMSILVEPKSPPARARLAENELKRRTAETVAELVNCGAQLIANSAMSLEPMDYGYRVSFRQTHEQAQALRGAVADCNQGVGTDWLTLLKIRTDGYSFVFDVMKIGATAPAMPVTTTQPGDKTWFKERKPSNPPSP